MKLPMCKKSGTNVAGSEQLIARTNNTGPMVVQSMAGSGDTKPGRPKPVKSAVAPRWQWFRGEVIGSKRRWSRAKGAESVWEMLRSGGAGPKRVKSATGRGDTKPKRAIPSKGAAESARACAREDEVEPDLKRSGMDVAGPIRERLLTGGMDSSRK